MPQGLPGVSHASNFSGRGEAEPNVAFVWLSAPIYLILILNFAAKLTQRRSGGPLKIELVWDETSLDPPYMYMIKGLPLLGIVRQV